MLGIFIGVICLLALARVARGRGRFGHGRHGRHRGGRFMLRRLFRRLNTGPGQERVVLGELDNLHDTLHGLRAELKNTRTDIAAIVRDETFDNAKLDTLFRKQDELLAKLRVAATSAIEKVHAVLDPRQKSELADMLERGFRRFTPIY